MNHDDDKNKRKDVKRSDAAFDLTTAQTDTESGNENLPEDQDREKSIKALKIMYEKGLVTDAEYKKRLDELKS